MLLRNYKAEMTKQNEKLKVDIKEATHEHEVRQNIAMLRLDLSPGVGQNVQISHHIHQIKVPIALRKRWKLCKHCLRDVNNM